MAKVYLNVRMEEDKKLQIKREALELGISSSDLLVKAYDEIDYLNKMIQERKELLSDEMARNMLGESGIDAIEYFINLYQERVKGIRGVIDEN